MAEESAEIAASFADPDGLSDVTSLMDQDIAVLADLVRTIAPVFRDETLGIDGINQIPHARTGGPAKCELPSLSHPRLELREQTDEISGLQALPEIPIVYEFELLSIECGRIPTKAITEPIGRDRGNPELTLDRADPIQSLLLMGHAL
jgi:hypothetical protein